MLLHISTFPHQSRRVTLRDHFESGLARMAFTEALLSRVYDKLRMQLQHKEAVGIALSQELCAGRHALVIGHIFDSIGVAPTTVADEAIAALTDELESVCASIARSAVRDSVCIALLQRMLHQKIACYGMLRAFAITLKEEQVVEWLESCLDEEKSFDKQWTVLSRTINDEAANKEY